MANHHPANTMKTQNTLKMGFESGARILDEAAVPQRTLWICHDSWEQTSRIGQLATD